MKIILELKEYEAPKSQTLSFNAEEFISSTIDELKKSQEEAREYLKHGLKTQVSFAEKVLTILNSPVIKRNNDGEIQKGPTGFAQTRPLSIIEQTKIFRIINEIDKNFKSKKSVEIELSPEDALYLAERIIEFYKFVEVPQKYAVDMYNFAVELEAAASAEIKKVK